MKRIIFFSFCVGLLLIGCATTNNVPKSDIPEPITAMISKNLSAIAGVGIPNISGGKSWDPKMRGLVGIETKLHKFSPKSSINTGFNLSFQGANYTESNEIEPYGFQLKSSRSASDEFSGKVTLTVRVLYFSAVVLKHNGREIVLNIYNYLRLLTSFLPTQINFYTFKLKFMCLNMQQKQI